MSQLEDIFNAGPHILWMRAHEFYSRNWREIKWEFFGAHNIAILVWQVVRKAKEKSEVGYFT